MAGEVLELVSSIKLCGKFLEEIGGNPSVLLFLLSWLIACVGFKPAPGGKGDGKLFGFIFKSERLKL